MVDLGATEFSLSHPFHNILRLSAGDFLAKTLNFLAFVYLARVLGVEGFGVLEFANALLMYFLLAADAGLDVWATREAAQAREVRELAGRVLPMKFLLAGAAFAVLLVLLPLLPNYPALRWVVVLYGLGLFAQAASLKWVFMAQEEMRRVGRGLVVAQVVFAAAVFAFIRGPAGLIWVPVLRLAGDLAMAVYFARLFLRAHGSLRIRFMLRGAWDVLRPAAALGTSQGLGLVNYNFDSILLGYLSGAVAVGWYNAAYRPVNVALALAVTFLSGLFPALARSHAEGRDAFVALVGRALRVVGIVAIPFGVGGTLLAAPIIGFLFGPEYGSAVAPLRILIWSAAVMMLGGPYRRALRAAHQQRLDLRCALVSAGLNVALNFLLIPRYGTVGAASATVVAEVAWSGMAWFYFARAITPLSPLPFFARPVAAGLAMAACLVLAQPLYWMVRGVLGLAVYFAALHLLGEREMLSWMPPGRSRNS
jgi:O-antigen/teichoic acid export membrane protein